MVSTIIQAEFIKVDFSNNTYTNSKLFVKGVKKKRVAEMKYHSNRRGNVSC